MTVRPPNPDALVRWVGGADQQLRSLQASPPPTWENFRWGSFQTITTSGGNAPVPFDEEFPHQCFVVILGNVGNNGAWFGFVTWQRPDAFGIWVTDYSGAAFNGTCVVHYVAFGF